MSEATKRTSNSSSSDGKFPDEPSLHILKGLAEQVKHKSVKEVKRRVYDFRMLFLDRWTELSTHTEFGNAIRVLSRREGVSRNMLGNMSNRETIAYFIGILAGVAYMSRMLYTAEVQDTQIVSVCSQNETVAKILQCLHNTNGGHGMYHTDLADKVGLTSGELTEIMKELLQFRAVVSNGTGEYTFYVLGPTGKRYYAKESRIQEVRKDAENRDAD